MEAIDQADHLEAPLFPEFEKVGRHVAVQEEVLILLAAVLVHAAAGVPEALILQVQRVMFSIEGQIALICC